MKRTTLSLPLCAAALLALGLAAPASASDHVRIHCKADASGHCPPPPPPPAPPAPPAAPAPPAPPADDGASADADQQMPVQPAVPAQPAEPAAPAMAAIPGPPPLPPLPEIPAVPAAAHAACASKAPGSALTWALRKGETMSGVCERHMGAMRFALRSYDRDD